VPLAGGPTAPPKPGRGLASASSPRLRGGSGGGGIRIDARAAAPAEINLVGLTVDEALPRVDKLLDEATVTGRSQVRVIHGFGQGKLKKAVAGLLEGHPQVASFHLAGASEGGGGATIVELKD
jgi:DNA mismatch repair protein MutS2